jgi:hypothetical protein
MTSRYLTRPIRTEAEVSAGRSVEREAMEAVGRNEDVTISRYRSSDREHAHWKLSSARTNGEKMIEDLEEATKRRPIGSGYEDLISAIKDIISDVQTRIERVQDDAG